MTRMVAAKVGSDLQCSCGRSVPKGSLAFLRPNPMLPPPANLPVITGGFIECVFCAFEALGVELVDETAYPATVSADGASR